MRDQSQQINRSRREDRPLLPETIPEGTSVDFATETSRRRFRSAQLNAHRETQSHQIVRQLGRNPYTAPENSNRANLRRFHTQENLVETTSSFNGPTIRSSYSDSTSISSRYLTLTFRLFLVVKLINT